MSEAIRVPLSRERVVAAALAYTDDHGESSLSMRKLGAELGVEAMSLYNHVANKEELLDAVSDLIYAEMLDNYRPTPGSTWQDDARMIVGEYRAAVHRHPNALGLMVDRINPSVVRYRFMKQVYDVFARAGVDLKTAGLAFDTVASWVVGALRQEVGIMRQLEEADRTFDRDGVSPEVAEVLDFAEASLAWTPDQRFEWGFETLMAGLEVQLQRG